MVNNLSVTPLIICLLILVACIINILIPAQEYTDSLSLFNPVYMYANYGKLVYPVHGYFDNMPVHPPFFYKIQGVIFSITQNKYWAYKLPVIATCL